MDEVRKNAFRYLLYVAMLEIRGVQWIANDLSNSQDVDRLQVDMRRVAAAGAVANWLHNLALFSATDFERFDEDAFWKQYEYLTTNFEVGFYYRQMFDQRLLETASLY